MLELVACTDCIALCGAGILRLHDCWLAHPLVTKPFSIAMRSILLAMPWHPRIICVVALQCHHMCLLFCWKGLPVYVLHPPSVGAYFLACMSAPCLVPYTDYSIHCFLHTSAHTLTLAWHIQKCQRACTSSPSGGVVFSYLLWLVQRDMVWAGCHVFRPSLMPSGGCLVAQCNYSAQKKKKKKGSRPLCYC